MSQNQISTRPPLPSISLVLANESDSDQTLPRRSSCIKLEPLPVPPSPTPTTAQVVDAPQSQPLVMTTVHVREFIPPPYLEDRCRDDVGKDAQSPHVVYVRDVDSVDFTLAESIYEVPLRKERGGIGRTVKRKISRAFFYMRDICFCRCSRP